MKPLAMLSVWLLTLVAAGCCLPPERESLRPLAEPEKLFSYAELLTRGRYQATAAVEAFYRDDWTELEQAAKVLEQTARFLPRTSDPPAHLKTSLDKESDLLRQEAVRLGEFARMKNVQSANASLQSINLAIRTLRPAE